MKIALLSIPAAALVLFGTASAFVNQQQTRAFVAPPSTTELFAEQQPTRKEFTQSLVASLASGLFLLSVVGQPQPVNAAKYGDFGAGSPEVLDPSTAEVDRDVLASETVQRALRQVQGYQAAVREMQAGLEADPQANIRSYILKQLDFANIRTTLNAFNAALDEDTQRGTDRLIRVILQDITELEVANKQKEGIPRSSIRLDTMKGKLAKLDKAFNEYLAFAK